VRLGRLDREHRQDHRRQRRGKIAPAEWLPDPGRDGGASASELHAAIAGTRGGGFCSESAATIASVVTRGPATEDASCKAVRTILVGSMIPARSLWQPSVATN
jgi:hypothetical protein